MFRYVPRYVLAFAPTAGFEFDVLIIGSAGGRRGRSSSQALEAVPSGGDPLPDPYAAVDASVCASCGTEPEAGGRERKAERRERKKKKQSPDRKKQLPGKRRTLPTPSDLPPPKSTDVPVPEPWVVPPTDPSDPRPRSVP